jgi:RES domain-containing protein
VLAWRIIRTAHSEDPLSGAGAARWGNRWNTIGVRMAYVSTSRPLAVLEMLVHLPREITPLDATLMPLEIPDDLIEGLPDLPEGWNHFPYRAAARRIGDRWIERGSSVAMFVPSAILPAERNILINPVHAHFKQIRIGQPEAHAFDRRLFGLQ